jgi:hypothetical protein
MQITKVRRFKIKTKDDINVLSADGQPALYRSRQIAHRKAKKLGLEDYKLEEVIFLPAIYSWTVQMQTEDGQTIELDDVPEDACQSIDYAIKEIFPDSLF